MKIKVKRVSEAALMPVRGSSHAAGYDLCAAIREELTVLPHTTVKVDTGLHNDSDVPRVIVPGEKIAQMIVLPYLALEFEETDVLTETERGAGGFGSTGK